MKEFEATLMWTLTGFKPVEGAHPGPGEGQRYDALSKAIAAYRSEKASRSAGGFLGWIKPHGSGGAPWLNGPQIEAIARTIDVLPEV